MASQIEWDAERGASEGQIRIGNFHPNARVPSQSGAGGGDPVCNNPVSTKIRIHCSSGNGPDAAVTTAREDNRVAKAISRGACAKGSDIIAKEIQAGAVGNGDHVVG